MSNKEMSESAAPTATESRKLIPKELAIETVFGCNLSCPMCFIDMPTKRKKGVMTMELFHSIVDSMAPYVNEIERVDLWSLGEPLLDHHLFERIGLLKERGFCNLAISTNADLMDADRRRGLLESGIETIIISIDGIDKQTYEKIRHGADFDRVVSNTENIIKMRDEGDYDTRFIIRFIRQADNFDQWERFKQFWNARLSQEKRDFA
ncbi:MAG TPA: radical SAM protein, partial [Nitrospirae bacterium]|nr:radical SAM protein [Nitrospirota bacterium]